MEEVLSECVLLTCAQPHQGPRCFRPWEQQSLLWVHVQMLAPCAGECHWWSLPSFRCSQPWIIDHYRHSLPWLAKPVSLSMICKTHIESLVCLLQSTCPPDWFFCMCVYVSALHPSLLGSRQPHDTRARLHFKCWRDLLVALCGPHLVTSRMACLLLNTFARCLYHLVCIELSVKAWVYLILLITSTWLLAYRQRLVKICCLSSWV